MYHRTDLGTIEGAIIHGLAQKALDLIPLLTPWEEPDYPPVWWYNYNWANTWRAHLNNRGVPDTWLIDEYLRYCWRMIGYYAEEIGDWARDRAQSWARDVTGYALHGWPTFSNWIEWIGIRLGSGMVFWAIDAVDGLGRLWNWLPPEIRTNLQSWGALFEGILTRAKNWVIATYQNAIAWGTNAWNWVRDRGNRIGDWWESARATLDQFRANPANFIISRLGSTWTTLAWFALNPLQFYVNLWSSHARSLSDFLADPAGWIYTRLESYLERIW